MKHLAQFGKGAFAGVAASLGTLVGIMLGTDIGFGDITDGQWLFVVLEGMSIAGGVWGIPYVPSQRAAARKARKAK